MNFIDGGAMT